MHMEIHLEIRAQLYIYAEQDALQLLLNELAPNQRLLLSSVVLDLTGSANLLGGAIKLCPLRHQFAVASVSVPTLLRPAPKGANTPKSEASQSLSVSYSGPTGVCGENSVLA